MPPPSMARDFFEQIRNAADPTAFIRALANSSPPTYETDWLDFKAQLSPNLKDAKWRDMWVEALCSFANNQGGVIIWGLDARKDPATNIDAACGEKPVDNPAGVKSRLVELQRQATDPPLANVEIEAYTHPAAPGTGFVVCLVPEGPFKPYRTEDGRRSQYHVRSGDNFTVLSRSMLQSLFYPRSKAVFRVEADLSWTFPDANNKGTQRIEARMDLEVRLGNKGTATARNIQFWMEQHNLKPHPPALDLRAGDGWVQDGRYGQWASVLLHPGMPPRKVFSWSWLTPATMLHGSQNVIVPTYHDPQFSFAVYSENQQPQHFKIQFDMKEVTRLREVMCEAFPEEET